MSKKIVKKIRFDEADIRRVEQDARAEGKNFSEYMRELTRREPAQHPEVIDVFNKLINEINHIGININQIARSANEGVLTYEDKKRLFAYLKTINKKVKEAIDLYGHK